MFMKQFTVLSKGNVEGSYRHYLLADETGNALSVYRCDWGKWPEFEPGEQVGVMQLGERLAWEAAGFDQDRVRELPSPTTAILAQVAELRNQNNNVCSA